MNRFKTLFLMANIFFVSKALQAGIETVSPIYHATEARDFVDITTINSSIQLDIRYATNNNFLSTAVYDAPRCFVLRFVADKLSAVQRELKQQGLGLKIFDGYRPRAVQVKMWNLIPDERYVANPAKGGRHTRGTTVDVTLVTLSDGIELEMPTPFDDFTQRAHSDATIGISPAAIKNRKILHEVMKKHGFEVLATEWWHFDVAGWQNYQPHNFTFAEIDAAQPTS